MPRPRLRCRMWVMRFSTIAVLSAVASTLAIGGASLASGPATAASRSLHTGVVSATPPSLDGVRLPISYAAAKRRFGTPSAVGPVEKGCFAIRRVRWRTYGLTLSFSSGRLRPLSNAAKAGTAAVTSSRWRTPATLHPGDRATRISRLYRSARYLGHGYWTLQSYRRNGQEAVLQAIVKRGFVHELDVVSGLSC